MPSRSSHYAEAERLTDHVVTLVEGNDGVVNERIGQGLRITLALAQVHATLATVEPSDSALESHTTVVRAST